jgi:hypothetical protein
MLTRRRFAVALLTPLTSLPIYAATGTLELRIRDSRNHHPVHAVIKGDGPSPFSLETDAKGYGTIELPIGDYRLEISASGYASLRTHYLVESGKTTRAGAFLDPQTVPGEESRAVLDPLLRAGYTLLHEYVVDADTGEPLRGVTVRLANAGLETKTDSKGHYVLSVPTPKPENPGGLGTDTLIYEKPGYKTIIFRNFGIGSAEMGPVAVDMTKGTGVIDEDATHPLMREQSENQESPQSAIARAKLSPDLYSWLGTTGSSFPIGPAATLATTTPQTVTVPASIVFWSANGGVVSLITPSTATREGRGLPWR